MNLILIHDADFISADRLQLRDPRRVRHLRKVLHARPGDMLRMGKLNGLCGQAELLSLDRNAAELRVTLDTPPPEPSPHRLVLALPRPPALRRILRAVTSMGLKRIALIGSGRVEGSFWQSSQVTPPRIHEQLELGLEQARDTLLPEVVLERRFSRFAREQLPEWLRDSRGLVGHPAGSRPCPRDVTDAITVVIGPEGGWLDAELAQLAAAGVEPVTLGDRPLSVETAVVALLSRLG